MTHVETGLDKSSITRWAPMKFDEKSPTTIEGNRRVKPLDRLRDREAAGLVLPIGRVKEKVLAARRDLPTHVRQ